MVDTQLLYPGCKVRIVDKWVKPSIPSMEPWRGKIMTIERLLTDRDIIMKETGTGLVWFLEEIEEIIGEIETEFDFAFSQESLAGFIF